MSPSKLTNLAGHFDGSSRSDVDGPQAEVAGGDELVAARRSAVAATFQFIIVVDRTRSTRRMRPGVDRAREQKGVVWLGPFHVIVSVPRTAIVDNSHRRGAGSEPPGALPAI